MGRVVAIDFGLKRIGVAISDESKIIARSLGAIAAKKKSEQSVASLLEFLKEFEIDQILLGNPLLLSGKQGLLADEVAHFAEKLRAQTQVPVILWDERFSTKQAERALIEGNVNRKRRTKVIDGLSAVVLLQSYLETLP
jgi:putative holliday junction resolvase